MTRTISIDATLYGAGVTEPLTPQSFAVSFRAFIDAVNQAAPPSPFAGRLTAHLGQDARTLPVLAEEFPAYAHPTLQRALDELLAQPGRTFERLGVAGQHKRHMNLSFSDLLAGTHLAEGPVDWVNVHLAGDEVLACVQFGLFLVADDDGRRYTVFVTGPVADSPQSSLRVEVGAPVQGDAEALLTQLRQAMDRLDVYRGHVLSLSTGHMFGPRGPNTVLQFHERAAIARDDVVLPDGVLSRIERHTVRFSQHADELREAGRSLRRGVLLYGPPGVGKTLTVKYLCRQLPERTVLLMTGGALGALGEMSTLARRLAPSMVVIEDVDLIAEERTMPWRGANPSFLFELLNEMDGLPDDVDVIYLLTTNRADLLEPALALRPGRVDLSVELPLPDEAGRLRLLQLYARGLRADGIDWAPYVTATAGASPAYIKEFLRQAALRSAEDGRGVDVTTSDLDSAHADLTSGGDLAQRLLGAVAEPSRAVGHEAIAQTRLRA
jgi:hypothetical protein